MLGFGGAGRGRSCCHPPQPGVLLSRKSRSWRQQPLKRPQKCVECPGMGSCRCSLCPIRRQPLEANQSRDVFTELALLSSHCLITTCWSGNLGQNCLLAAGKLHVFPEKTSNSGAIKPSKLDLSRGCKCQPPVAVNCKFSSQAVSDGISLQKTFLMSGAL